MKLSDIEFFLKEAWTGFLRSGIMSLISVVTITISLVLFGIFLLILLNVNNLVDGLNSKLEIVLYVKNIPSAKTLQALKGRIQEVNGVEEVRFISRTTAWKTFQKSFQGKISLEGYLGENPLPDSFVVKVTSLGLIPDIAQQLSVFPEIDDIRYGGELAARVHKFATAVSWGGWGIIILIGMATLLIVVNTIRLTVIARFDEINIMKLVGATDHFVKWPFIIEGVIIGAIGSVVSTLLLRIGYSLLVPYLQGSLPFLPFVYSTSTLSWIYANVLIAGIFLGFLGGYISVSKSLKDNVS